VIRLQVYAPAALSDAVQAVVLADPTVTAVSVHRGASVVPVGDVIEADIPREASERLLSLLLETGVQHEGSVHLQPVPTWVSRDGFRATLEAPGAGRDAIVWPEVVQRAYDESEISWTFLAFMTLATLIAGVAIILDSPILIIGAMVLGPEFGAVAALGVGLIRRRFSLLRQAIAALVIGFAVAILLTTAVGLIGRLAGWITVIDIAGPRPGTSFIYHPDRWSLVIAVLAGVAGVLSITSARSGALVGVFISVTTIPAAGDAGMSMAFGLWDQVLGSALQLTVNITGMALAGWATLAVMQFGWRVVGSRARRLRRPADHPHAGDSAE